MMMAYICEIDLLIHSYLSPQSLLTPSLLLDMYLASRPRILRVLGGQHFVDFLYFHVFYTITRTSKASKQTYAKKSGPEFIK